MSASKDKKAGAKKAKAAPAISDDDAAAFLRANPDFLTRYPSLLDTMTPPDRIRGEDTGVADMQAHMIRRLRDQLADAAQKREMLLTTALANTKAQDDAHAAVLALMAAKSLDEAVSCVLEDWPGLIGVDVITLAAESATNGLPHGVKDQVFALTPGSVDALLGEGVAILLSAEPHAREGIYGNAAPLVQSDALIRLSPSANAPVGVLALGSREAGLFAPDQGTDLLRFLGAAVERSLRLWLDLP